MSKPGMQRQAGHGLAHRGDMARIIDGVELAQEFSRVCKRARRRRIDPRQSSRIGNSPGCEFKRERGEVGSKYLWRIERHERTVLRFRPHPVADARSEAARATAPLLCR